MPVVRTIGHGTELVVFVPGMPGTHAMFHPVLERVPEGTECVVVDLPDTGEAPEAPEATIDDLERDVAQILSGQHGPVTAVGLSVGAQLIARVLPEVSDHVARVVLLGGLPSLPNERRAEMTQLADALESGAMTKAQITETALARWLGGARSEQTEREPRAMLEAEPAERIVRALRRLAAVDDTREAKAFETPGVCLHGRGDPAVAFEQGKRLAALGARCEMHPIDTDAHLLPVTHTELVADVVFER